MIFGRKLSGRMPLAGLLLATLATSFACFKAAPEPATSAVSITLSPSTTTLGPGQDVIVAANVYDVNGQGATWTVAPFDFGSFTKTSTTSVTYTAPASFSTAETVTITATSIADPTVSSSVQVSVIPITVSISVFVGTISVSSAQTLTQGGQLAVTANVLNDVTSKGVKWSLSPASGAGLLTSVAPFQVNYNAPSTVSSPITATLTATAMANSSAVANMQISVLPSGGGGNVALVTVDGGPVPGEGHPNAPYTTILICKPGSTSACQNVGGILVDTGSSGLRILQSEIPLLKLAGFADTNGNTLHNCFPVTDKSFIWGPVMQADIYIAGEIATKAAPGVNGVPIHVISESTNEIVPDSCSNGGTNLNTAQLLGANGILGIGPEPTDCTVGGKNRCDGTQPGAIPNVYYSCLSSGCLSTDSPVIINDNLQVANPVPLFASFSPTGPDVNGVILDLPAATGAETKLQGRLIFGIGTETDSLVFDTADDSLGNATVFTLDANDHFTTILNGRPLTGSSIASGANAVRFPGSLPVCTAHDQFFCPSALTNFSAINQGATHGKNTVDFSVGNADELFLSNPSTAVFDTLGGPDTSAACGKTSCGVVWGLPFFYGRKVYTAIAGQTVSGAPASPWWAYYGWPVL